MLAIRCVGGCGGQSEDSSVCFGAKPTQKAWARDLPWDLKRTREEGPRHSRQEKATEVGRIYQSRKQTSRQKSGEADGRERPLKMPGWPTQENESAFPVALW